jgi:non-ribosomal peptide synthetase component F
MTTKRPASRTLGDLLDEIASVTPSAEAVVFRDERLDYAGLKAQVDGFARHSSADVGMIGLFFIARAPVGGTYRIMLVQAVHLDG